MIWRLMYIVRGINTSSIPCEIIPHPVVYFHQEIDSKLVAQLIIDLIKILFFSKAPVRSFKQVPIPPQIGAIVVRGLIIVSNKCRGVNPFIYYCQRQADGSI